MQCADGLEESTVYIAMHVGSNPSLVCIHLISFAAGTST